MGEQHYLDNLRQLWSRHWPEGAPTSPQYPRGRRPLSEYLSGWAAEQPDKPAIHFYGYDVSYRELDQMSNRFADLLRELGIERGDGVALFMPNCPQFNIAYWGSMKYGAIHVPVSPLAKEFELGHQLGDCKPKALVCFDALLPVAQPVCRDLGIETILSTSVSELKPANPTLPLPDLFDLPKTMPADGVLDFFESLDGASSEPQAHAPELDDVAALNYTGGSTGLPKGCVHTHRNILETVAAFLPVVFGEFDGKASDRVEMNFLPEFWIAGENTGLLFPVFSGATLVLLARWDADAYLEAVQHYKVNRCVMLVDSVDEVLNHPRVADYDLSSIEETPCVSFIKKLNKDYRRRWHELTGSTMFETAYGMTETHTCDTFTRGLQADDYDLSFDPTFVGLPVPGTEIKITDFETGELLPQGAEGEICVRSPTLLKGYWNSPELNDTLFADGWFRTGDLGQITEEGFIRYLGRRKEMLKVKGISVFPTEIEYIFGRHPAIAACGVIGRSDEEKGQVPVAFVTLKPGAEETEESLVAWCRESMAIYKVPEIRVLDALPMTATGKIRKIELEKLLE